MSKRSNKNTNKTRSGVIAPLVALLLIPILGAIALAVDYGYLLALRTDLQRAADQAALAAVQELIPAPDGTQDLDSVRAAVRHYAEQNLDLNNFQIDDADIEIGRYDPATIYTNFTILNSGIFDTVRVTLRRDDVTNGSVSLYFARVLGIEQSDVMATATAVLQKARYLPDGSDVLPMSIPQSTWDSQNPGDTWTIYGDGKVLDTTGQQIPGNWGTLDIGSTSNSTSDLDEQIRYGLDQNDLDSLYSDGSIPDNTHIDSQDPMWLNADTGISTGLKHSVRSVHGDTKLIPIYDTVNDSGGNNLQYHIVGWGVVKVVTSNWGGAKNTWVNIQKAYTYDGDLIAHGDLSETGEIIEAAYTAPVLVQ